MDVEAGAIIVIDGDVGKDAFKGCTGIRKIRFTENVKTIGESAFEGCTNLTMAPALPATTLKDACYQNMFKGCTSLTTPPGS